MPLFQRKKPLSNTVAAPAAPLPPLETTVNHHYHSSRIGVIFSAFCVIVAAVILAWFGLVFLAEQAGARQPEFEVARCLVGLAAVGVILAALGLAAKFFLNDFYRHREAMEQMHLQALEKRARLAQGIAPQAAAGMPDEDKRKYRAVMLAMDTAYQSVDEKGKLRTKNEPWSRRSVGALTLLGEAKPIGEDTELAKWVKPWLLGKNIILDDRRVNLEQYPDLNAVETALIAEFGRPILLYRPGQNEAGMSGHYIDKGAGSESWG